MSLFVKIAHIRLKSYKNSFIPYATKLWNQIPISTPQSPSLNIFKNLITPKILCSNYNKLCSGYYGRLLTRLILELSGLNAHRFKYNLFNTPTCSLCFLGPEDNRHFFFYCPTHDLPRQHFLNQLQSELELDTTNQVNTLKIILYGNINHNLHTTLLQIIYQYFKHTGRFDN